MVVPPMGFGFGMVLASISGLKLQQQAKDG
uniref:Uncharacterized protein n=1 Tax=Arundo donax TaxID=35708 RepID=A0A0A9BEY9_ARUDO